MSPGNKFGDETVNDILLEKLKICSTNKVQDSGDSVRSIAAKIHGRVTSSGEFIHFSKVLFQIMFTII